MGTALFLDQIEAQEMWGHQSSRLHVRIGLSCETCWVKEDDLSVESCNECGDRFSGISHCLLQKQEFAINAMFG